MCKKIYKEKFNKVGDSRTNLLKKKTFNKLYLLSNTYFLLSPFLF